MRSGRILPHVGEVEVQRNEEAFLGLDALPHSRIRCAAQSLVGHTIGLVTSSPEQFDVALPQVLVEFHRRQGHRSGTSSASRARAAAYAMAARTSSTVSGGYSRTISSAD